MQGTVVLEAIIGTDGEVRSARVLRSAGALLDQAAEKAILGWRYRPARVAGRPVAVYLTVTARFGIA
jgi:protein TonB